MERYTAVRQTRAYSEHRPKRVEDSGVPNAPSVFNGDVRLPLHSEKEKPSRSRNIQYHDRANWSARSVDHGRRSLMMGTGSWNKSKDAVVREAPVDPLATFLASAVTWRSRVPHTRIKKWTMGMLASSK